MTVQATMSVTEFTTPKARQKASARMFGVSAKTLMLGESMVFGMLESLSKDYKGAMWKFAEAENGALFMYPDMDTKLNLVVTGNYFQGEMSPKNAGIVACLFVYCRLAEQHEHFIELFHRLRDYVLTLEEGDEILSAID